MKRGEVEEIAGFCTSCTIVAAGKDRKAQLGDVIVLCRRSHGSTHGALDAI